MKYILGAINETLRYACIRLQKHVAPSHLM
jgi:hypothetical protein